MVGMREREREGIESAAVSSPKPADLPRPVRDLGLEEELQACGLGGVGRQRGQGLHGVRVESEF